MKKFLFPISLVSIVFLFACSKDNLQPRTERLVLPDTPYDYTDVPWSSPYLFDNTPLDNPITNDGATLGRVLFHDKRLSKSNRISCAGCHVQQKGFADEIAKSKGFVNEETRRNSIALINLKEKPDFFWDQRVSDLESQVMLPISDHIEMGLEDEDLLFKLNELEYYPGLFDKAFGDEDVTLDRISKALAQYMRSIQSFSTKWDEGSANNFENFTVSEENGRDLFFNGLHCGTCHNGKDLRGWGSANIGLNMEYEDNGVGEWNDGIGNGRFAIPSLRNISHSGPYMHDGRFETLEEVIDHYAKNIEPHDFLDFRLRFGNTWGNINFPNIDNNENNSNFGDPLTFTLTNEEKQDLINFLHTLTDDQMMRDPKFSNPFIYE